MKPAIDSFRPDISTFSSYRTFLKALYLHQKTLNPKVSFQGLAKKMKTNPSYLKHVFEERRHIGLDRISKISSVFSLTPFEADYFMVLVVRDLTTEPQMKERLSGVLGGISFREINPAPYHSEPRTPHGAFVAGNWLAAAICALTKFTDFCTEPGWIRSKLIEGEKIPELEIERVLAELKDRSIIFKEGEKWRGTDFFGTSNPYQPTSLQIYGDSVGKTLSVLNDAGKFRTCRFYVETCALDRDGENEVIEAFNQYVARVTDALKKARSPDRVIHFSNNLFTLVRNY